jgi:cytochrome c oxidase subunit 2
MSKLQGLLFGLATLVLVVLATFFFMRPWLPPLKSDRIGIDHAIFWTLLVTGVVFIGTNLMLAWFAFRYQDHAGAQASYWHDDPRLEWTWTLVTAGIMFVFLFNALSLWAQIQSPAPKDALVVEVTGQQFRWVVRYPGKDGVFGRTSAKLVNVDEENYIGLDRSDPAAADDRMAVNELYLPADRPVRVQIRSTDVIHSFFLPNFRVKQDAMPGMTVETWFVPKAVGDFEIACAEHCGLGHYRMRGQVHVVPANEYDAKLDAAFAQ